MLDRAISTKFLTHRVSLQSSHANFQKKNFSQKMAAILNLPSSHADFPKNFVLAKMADILNFCANIAKHKNAYILKTLLDRAISMKFLTHRVSLQSTHANFQKKRFLTKNGGHFEFSDFFAILQNIKMLISRKAC